MNIIKKYVFIVLFFFTPSVLHAEETLPDPIALVEQCQQSYEALSDYTAIFIKEQRLRGKLRKPETIFMKFQKPFSIYMKWIKNPDKGKEVIYVEGQNDGKIVAHLGGIVGLLTPTTIRLEPTHPLAMGGNLKPITQAGLGNMIDSLVKIFSLAKENGDLETSCKGKTQLNGRSVYAIERILPDKEEYPNTLAVIYIDVELMLPVYYAAYNAEGQLLQKYIYKDLKTNVGLSEKDFDKSNKEYKYPLF